MLATAAVFLGTIAAVAFAAVTGISDWSQLVILGGIGLATIGTMLAVDPLRRER